MKNNINENNINNNEYVNENIILSNTNNADNIDNIDNLKIKTQQDLINEYYQKIQKQKYERFIEITMNQTTYTRDEAIANLEKHNGDITLVIKEFLGVIDKSNEHEKEKKFKSLHQKRYDIIREYMDNASINFMKKQEQTKRYNEFIEKRKQSQEQAEAQERVETQERVEAQGKL